MAGTIHYDIRLEQSGTKWSKVEQSGTKATMPTE